MAKPLYKNAAFWLVVFMLLVMIAVLALAVYQMYKRVKGLEEQEKESGEVNGMLKFAGLYHMREVKSVCVN